MVITVGGVICFLIGLALAAAWIKPEWAERDGLSVVLVIVTYLCLSAVPWVLYWFPWVLVAF